MRISKRAECVTPFLVMDVLERAHELEKQGVDVVHLEIGEPDFDTPQVVKDAACKALADGHTHYTHSQGIPALREAIAEHYRREYGVDVDPCTILVTQGTSPAMLALFAALLEDGDEVILSDPGYACYPNFIRFAGAEPRFVRVSEADAYQYRAANIRAALTPRTRAIIVNSPANPTGQVLADERKQAIADIAAEHPLWVVSDEIYHGLVYEGRDRSMLEFTDRAFVLSGFSKLQAMTGWRLGWLIAPPWAVRGLQKLCQNFFISANAPAQHAGIAALTLAGDDIEHMRATYARRRRVLLDGLQALGFAIPHEPTGAFYVLVNAEHLAEPFGGSSLKLAYDILERAHVGVTPGIDFGPGAEGCLRFSYANSVENIEKGLERLGRYIAERG